MYLSNIKILMQESQQTVSIESFSTSLVFSIKSLVAVMKPVAPERDEFGYRVKSIMVAFFRKIRSIRFLMPGTKGFIFRSKNSQ